MHVMKSVDLLMDGCTRGLTNQGFLSDVEVFRGSSLALLCAAYLHARFLCALLHSRWTVPDGFPSKEVINAYNNPQVME